MSYYLKTPIDFVRHNEAVRALWREYRAGTHARIPVVVTGSIRNLLSNPELNRTGFTFRDFFMRAQAQVQCQLAYQHYRRHHWPCDQEMGIPAERWELALDFQNSHDQAWFGCPIVFFGDTDVPDTQEILKEHPAALYDWGDPDPFWGRGDFMKRAVDMYAEMCRLCDGGLEFDGLPVRPPIRFPGTNTDGVFDCAVKLRGAVEVMTDMMDDPRYFHDLMDYISRNLVRRMKALREWMWDHNPAYRGDRQHRGAFYYADDSIAMLSSGQFEEFVLPYTARIFESFHDGRGCTIHLCGDATHHFKRLADRFNVTCFDTGFPVDHGWLRRQLGPGVQINGGPTVMTIKDGPPARIRDEVRRICASGVLEGGRFQLIAANNVAPCTPVEHIDTLYEAGKTFGRLRPAAGAAS